MTSYRMHQKVKKQDTDGLPHHNDAMTSAPKTIPQLVHYSYGKVQSMQTLSHSHYY